MLNNLAQHYTHHIHADLLVKQMGRYVEHTKLLSGIDLGAGKGVLLDAALKKWEQIKFSGIDVDLDKNNHSDANRVAFFSADLLTDKSVDFLEHQKLIDCCDIAVCNPPFQSFQNNQLFRNLCKINKFEACYNMPVVTTDIIFLLHNLRLLKPGGLLGIILPDGILTGKRFQILRKSLLETHNIKEIIQLPDKAFSRIEVRTHMIILQKSVLQSNKIELRQVNNEGKLSKKLTINDVQLEKRMDYSYWKWQLQQQIKKNTIKLSDLNVEVLRGSQTKYFFEQQNTPYFHTQHLPTSPKKISFSISKASNVRKAKKGDILMARVGKRCLGRMTLVCNGSVPITDCIYRIRVPQKHLNIIWKSLSSRLGQEWLKANGHGSCAQVISKSDLMDFPIQGF
jgi:type I restriction enzyme M protein